MTGHPRVAKAEVIRGVKSERRNTLALLRSLEPDRFDVPTALPGWRVREVVAHLITTDRASVLGSILPVVLSSGERLERWNDSQVPKWANRSVPELLIGLDRWGRRLARSLGAMPQALFRLNIATFLGRVPAGLLAWSRVYDEWVHRQDIRRALGMPDEEVDLASAAEFLLTAVSMDTVRKLEGRQGRLLLSLKDAPLPPWRFDLKAGSGGPDGAEEVDAYISVQAPAFIMAAAGRDRFEDLLATGSASIEGDEPLARAFLAELRIV